MLILADVMKLLSRTATSLQSKARERGLARNENSKAGERREEKKKKRRREKKIKPVAVPVALSSSAFLPLHPSITG